MNALTLIVLIALAVGVVVAYRLGALAARRDARVRPVVDSLAPPSVQPPGPVVGSSPPVAPDADAGITQSALDVERARLVRSYADEADRVQRALVARDADVSRLATLADDRAKLFADIADARAEAARYRQLVVDIENNAPPPLLESPTAPDDLKLIVGIGPVLERMLQQLGVSTYRQIARWSERDIDEFDARLAEFPGRIRRDAWVTQARALHQSKYGESAVSRERS